MAPRRSARRTQLVALEKHAIVAAATPDFLISFVRDYLPLKSLRPAPLSAGYVCDARRPVLRDPLALLHDAWELTMARVLFQVLVAAGIVVSIGAPVSANPTAGRKSTDATVVNPQIFLQGDGPYPARKLAFPGGVTCLPDKACRDTVRWTEQQP
jgi:hypothetical protein